MFSELEVAARENLNALLYVHGQCLLYTFGVRSAGIGLCIQERSCF